MSTFVAIDKQEEEITEASIKQLNISEGATTVPSTNETSSVNDSTSPNAAISQPVIPDTTVVTTTEQANIKIIDWDEAMSSIGGSEEFLHEVVQDLLKEASTAEDDIGKGMNDKDLTAIMKAAHRIGGSASYFSCEDLVGRASAIKHVAQEALKAKETASEPSTTIDPALMVELTNLFAKFATSANILREEVARRFAAPDSNSSGVTASAAAAVL